ncbi:MAG: efflux transporter periplasmic adaptor subunit, partial [Candidatus Competibacter denitrificans]
MRASPRLLLPLPLLLALAVSNGAYAQQQPGGPPPPPPAVTVVSLKAETVTLTRELPGRTNPYRVAEVRPQVSGIIQ